LTLYDLRQQVFNRVTDHLLSQQKKSMTVTTNLPDGQCRYRSDSGLKCAIGALIPDDKYQPDMEGCTAPALIQRFGWEAVGLDGSNLTLDEQYSLRCFLDNLQCVHDLYAVEDWKKELLAVAMKYKLDYPITLLD